MPSFDLIDKVELFVRTGTFQVGASKSSKKVTRAASKHFIYKDGCLWRSYRGRLLRVVRSDEEVREILARYHDNNNHAGRSRAVKEIMLMYYWVGVTEAVKNWVRACAVCQSKSPAEPPDPPVRFCLAYGCDASNYVYPGLSFHRFPKEAEKRRLWLAVAQRDEGSLRMNSCLCSRHFEPSCFTLSEDGQLTLPPDAVPTIFSVTVQEDEELDSPDKQTLCYSTKEARLSCNQSRKRLCFPRSLSQVSVPSDEDFLQSSTLEDFLSTAAAAAEPTEPTDPAFDQSETPVELQEHQYSLPAPDPESMETVEEYKRRKTIIEPSFAVYNQIARYLSHRILPMQSKQSRFALKRMSKRFGLIDGVLMYTRVSPPLRVPRSREEVNSILKQFHDNQGHYGQGICQRQITKHFYWASMTRDLARWINSCNTCLNRTKRKWLRCSVNNCTNCCGPVERGLGLTFHRFPLHNTVLLTQWLRAVGRPNWHPRLRSSICSTHFTEDCFDRSGDKVTLTADAVPTLLVHGDSATPSRGPAQPAVGEEAYFAKYDAVELYLSRRIYPPGLSYVEKNTFRRFCKKFAIKDGELHMVSEDRLRLVLRTRQQVEAALVDYHNELNHLGVNKSLRLLSERYFWKTMKADVMQWVNSCSQCSRKKKRKPETEAGRSESLISPQIHEDVDSGKDDDDCSDDDEDDGGDVGEAAVSVAGEEQQPENPAVVVESSSSSQPVTPVNPQPRIPILLHLRAPIHFQPKTPIILQPRTPNTPFVARLWSVNRATPNLQKRPNSSDVQPENQNQSLVQVQERQTETGSSDGSARTHHCVKVQETNKLLTESHPPPEPTAKLPQPATKQIQLPSHSRGTKTQKSAQSPGVQRLEKREIELAAFSSAKRSSGGGLEPVVASSTKPWPVCTITQSAPTKTAGPPPEVDSPALFRRPGSLQARTVIQQCSTAKVKTKPAVDGADTEWAEIQEGIVVYVCFFHGATEDATYEMANSLMTTRFFRKDTGHCVSVLDLPGSVLLIPQDSLIGEPVPKRKIQYKGGCELWWGAQLFSNLVSACRELMDDSAKCTKAGVKVEHGVYGQKQEVALNSVEPLTLLLEF